MINKKREISTAAMPRPASPIFKSLWENLSGVSSALFIVQTFGTHRNPFLLVEVETKAAPTEAKIQEPILGF
jgi:hypothetical protein